MTKAPKNLHENLAAITFLMENTGSARLDKGKGMGCRTWGKQGREDRASPGSSSQRETREQAYY